MLAQSASVRGASCRFICLFLWGISGACATYENAQPDDGGTLGNAGSETGGSAGTEPVGAAAGSAGSSSGTGGVATTGGVAAGGAAGMSAGAGGMAGSSGGASGSISGGASGHAGASGAGGSAGGAAGSGGKSSGGSGGAGGKASGGSAGNGGSGGSVATQTCAKNPIPVKSKWVVTASSSSNADPVGNAHDGVLTNRWSTGKEQVGGEWLQLDFGVPVTLTKLTLGLGSSINDYPRIWATRFSNTPLNQAGPVLVTGMGAASTDTVVVFPAGTTARYVLISQSGMAPALWWSVAEIQAECAD